MKGKRDRVEGPVPARMELCFLPLLDQNSEVGEGGTEGGRRQSAVMGTAMEEEELGKMLEPIKAEENRRRRWPMSTGAVVGAR